MIQRIVFLCGAVYDLVFALIILFAPVPVFSFLGIAYPSPAVYLKLCGIFLIMIGWLYGCYAMNPGKYTVMIPVAIFGRSAGFILFVGGTLWWHLEWFFLLLGLIDGLFAFLHGFAMYADRNRNGTMTS